MTDEEWRAMLARCALACDTAMSRAMLRALGIEPKRKAHRGSVPRPDPYEGARECFAQRHGVTL